jgi:group I intron endonuclease
MKRFLVYKITCIPTSQIYIGVTSSQAHRRFHSHFYNAQNLHKKGKIVSKFQSELLKYGKDYFKCSILEENLSKIDALKKEIFYIEQYNSNLCGLNSNSGGGGCPTHNDETKKKMSKSRRGIPRPQEVIEKLRIANIGRKFSAETRKKIGDASRGRVASAETREKLRKANTGRKIILCEESKEKIRCAARYKRTEEHKNNLRNINKGNKYHSYTWKVTLPDNTVKFTKTLSTVINDDKLIRALMSIYRKLKTVKNNKNYGGFTFPHHGYTIQKCNEVYSGLIDEITALNAL